MNGSVVAFIDCNTNSFVNELSEELTFTKSLIRGECSPLATQERVSDSAVQVSDALHTTDLLT